MKYKVFLILLGAVLTDFIWAAVGLEEEKRAEELARYKCLRIEELYEQMKPEDVLGSGAFGLVVKIDVLGMPLALKIAHLVDDKGEPLASEVQEALKDSISDEGELLEELRSFGVVHLALKGVLPKRQIPFILMDFYHYTLWPFIVRKKDYLEKGGVRKWNQFIFLVVESLLDALVFVHAKGYFHGDIKPGNILLRYIPEESSYEVVLADFGLCSEEGDSDLCYTEGYRPPREFLEDQKYYGAKSDLWVLAKVILELLSEKIDFQQNYVLALTFSLISDHDMRKKEIRKSLLFTPFKATMSVLAKLLEKNHLLRIGADEASQLMELFRPVKK